MISGPVRRGGLMLARVVVAGMLAAQVPGPMTLAVGAPPGAPAGETMTKVASRQPEAAKAPHIVLLGASIGKGWHVEELPARAGTAAYSLEYVGEFQFDKRRALEQILARAERPDAVILKECAAYFPGDLEHQRQIMTEMIGQCSAAGVRPILATVVPVTADRGLLASVRQLIKRLLLRRPERLTQVLLYNDWVRSYGAQNGLAVLDLEAAVRRGVSDRSLAPEFDAGDGLHVNAAAYRKLDVALATLLGEAGWD